MRFDLFAVECPCNGCTRKDSSGVCVTPDGELCPLWHASKMHPGLEGRECGLVGHFAMVQLSAFGYRDLADAIHTDFEPRFGSAFGHELLAAAEQLRASVNNDPWAAEARLEYGVDDPAIPELVQTLLAIAVIADAGNWFLHVTRYGYAVTVVYR